MMKTSIEHLKCNWAVRTILQQQQDLEKIIEDQGQALLDTLPWLLEQVFGSLDGDTSGWALLQQPKGGAVENFLKPSGPLMELSLGFQSCCYDIPVASLPSCVREPSCQARSLLWPVSDGGLQQPSHTLSLNGFELYLFYFACVPIAQQQSTEQLCSVTKSLYFQLLEMYMYYFLPLEGRVPIHPYVPVGKGSSQQMKHCSPSSGSLLRARNPRQRSSDGNWQDGWASKTILQVFTDLWILNFNQEKTLTSHIRQPVFLPNEVHVLVVRQLLKHLHAFSGHVEANPQTSAVWHFLKLSIDQTQRRVLSFLLYLFSQWPAESSFRVVFETWLSFIQPWRYTDHNKQPSRVTNSIIEDHWSSFVQDNLFLYSGLFRLFLRRATCIDFTNRCQALMLYRMSKVFAQPGLKNIIQTGEQKIMHQYVCHHSTLNREESHMPHVSQKTTDDSLCKHMFDEETSSEVLRLIHMIDQALAASSSCGETGRFLPSWCYLFSMGSPVKASKEIVPNAPALKTVELLRRARVLLCQIFKVKMKPMDGLTLTEDEEGTEQLPDCIEGEHGLVLTDLGRLQIINQVRKFRVEYQGDPDLQPVRSYESYLLVGLTTWLASHINSQLWSLMVTLCARQDLLGKVSRHIFQHTNHCSWRTWKNPTKTPLSGHSEQRVHHGLKLQGQQHYHGPRVSLRVLASYRTLVFLLLVYVLGCLLCTSPLLLCGLVILLALLNPLSFLLGYAKSGRLNHVRQRKPGQWVTNFSCK